MACFSFLFCSPLKARKAVYLLNNLSNNRKILNTMAKKGNKSFNEWLYEEVEDAFGLTRLRSLPITEELAQIKLKADHPARSILEEYRLEVFDYVDTWNEDEYKFNFISPYFKLVNFNTKYFKIFTQRPLSVKYENDTKTTSGNVEFMLAKGKQSPKKPHFFLHEYKPEKNRDNDPLGQLLIAMVAAQKINQDESPIYGIYVNGRNWFVVVLEGKNYATTLSFDITSNDIFDLFAVLETLKLRLENMYKDF